MESSAYSAVSDPTPGFLCLASSARRVRPPSGAGGRASACHPRLGRRFPDRPICRAPRALRPARRDGWAEKQSEFRGSRGETRAMLSLGFFSFSAPARLTYFLEVALERAFTTGMRGSSQIRPAPLSATLPRIPQRWLHFPPRLATSSLPFFPFLSSQSPTPLASSEERHDWPAKGGSARSAKVLPASAGASLLLRPGASLSLGCAKRPLMVRFPGGTSRAPGKVLFPQNRGVCSLEIP